MTNGELSATIVIFGFFFWALGGGLFWGLYYLKEYYRHIVEHGSPKKFLVSFAYAQVKCGFFPNVYVAMLCVFWPFILGTQAIGVIIGMPFYGVYLLTKRGIRRQARIAYIQKTYKVDKAQAKKLASSKEIESLKALNQPTYAQKDFEQLLLAKINDGMVFVNYPPQEDKTTK